MTQARSFLFAILFAAGLGSCATPATREPGNLSVAKNQVKAYVDSGAYNADLAAAAKPAMDWITRRANSGIAKPAVVFDIDETTLSNLDHMTKFDWGYQPASWSKWVLESKATAIRPAREVFLTARAHHVSVFFITGRRQSEKAATARNLRAQGMGDFAEMFVRSDSSQTPIKAFKTSARKQLTDQGYTIIANVGDQQSDLDGGYAQRTFKLPNPFYLIP